MAFVNMHIFFTFYILTSLLLLTVTLRGVSNKHCLLSLFSFHQVFHFDYESMNMNNERLCNGYVGRLS